MRTPRLALLGFTLVLAAAPIAAIWPQASGLVGVPKIIDGDTIDVGGKRVRLFGIDAPESAQFCTSASGAPWPCGRDATDALRRIISNRAVRCEQKDTDRYGRIVAICFAEALDVNGEMVRTGMAVAYRRYSLRYDDDELAARLARRGMWSGAFVLPERWRRGER